MYEDRLAMVTSGRARQYRGLQYHWLPLQRSVCKLTTDDIESWNSSLCVILTGTYSSVREFFRQFYRHWTYKLLWWSYQTSIAGIPTVFYCSCGTSWQSLREFVMFLSSDNITELQLSTGRVFVFGFSLDEAGLESWAESFNICSSHSIISMTNLNSQLLKQTWMQPLLGRGLSFFKVQSQF